MGNRGGNGDSDVILGVKKKKIVMQDMQNRCIKLCENIEKLKKEDI